MTGTIGTRYDNGTIRVEFLQNGEPQPFYQAWNGAVYVAGITGVSYELRVSNMKLVWLEVLASIDTMDTQNGGRADVVTSRGLVVDATDPIMFSGWCLDTMDARKFVFGDLGHISRTAAQASGGTSRIGVIGFAAYRERRAQPTPHMPAWPQEHATRGSGAASRSTRNTEPATTRSSSGIDAGALYTAQFARDSTVPVERLVFGYGTYDSLVQRGIIIPELPDPFPGL